MDAPSPPLPLPRSLLPPAHDLKPKQVACLPMGNKESVFGGAKILIFSQIVELSFIENSGIQNIPN